MLKNLQEQSILPKVNPNVTLTYCLPRLIRAPKIFYGNHHNIVDKSYVSPGYFLNSSVFFSFNFY